MTAGREPDLVHVEGTPVRGLEVDAETRCAHYGSERDVIAIRFRCCGAFYPCFRCHEAIAGHEAQVWPADARAVPAVLCGVCGHELTIERYLAADHACPACGTAFNPGCADHHERYFET